MNGLYFFLIILFLVSITLAPSDMYNKIKNFLKLISSQWWFVYAIAFILLGTIAIKGDIVLGMFKTEDGKQNLWAEFHGVIFDLLLFAIILKAYERSKENKENIKRLFEELEDYKYWKGEESAYRRIGIINRLIKNNVKTIDLSYHTFKEGRFINFHYDNLQIKHGRFSDCIFGKGEIKNCLIQYTKFVEGEFQNIVVSSKKIRSLEFIKTKFYNSSFNDIPLPFTEFRNCWFVNTKFINCNLEDVDFSGSLFTSDFSFEGCNLKDAEFDGTFFPYIERKELIALLNKWIGVGQTKDYILHRYSIINNGEVGPFGVPEIYPIGQVPKNKIQDKGCFLQKIKKRTFMPSLFPNLP
jgi:hypothetical protein